MELALGNARPKSIAGQIVSTIEKLENTPSGFRHRDVYLELNNLCLRNPVAVASLILDEDEDEHLGEKRKIRLLFSYSSDHGGSCRIVDNPKWTRMMRNHIVNKVDRLQPMLQHTIHWYQDVQGL